MLAAERHIEVPHGFRAICGIADLELVAAKSIQPGSKAPHAYAERSVRLCDLVPGDLVTTVVGVGGTQTPIEWRITETTARAEVLVTGSGRYRAVAQVLPGVDATIVLNIYGNLKSVAADLSLESDEAMPAGQLRDFLSKAVDEELDTWLERGRQKFPVLQQMVVTRR